MRSLLRKAAEDWDIAFTPDGPRGPLREVQPGVILAGEQHAGREGDQEVEGNHARSLGGAVAQGVIPCAGRTIDTGMGYAPLNG